MLHDQPSRLPREIDPDHHPQLRDRLHDQRTGHDPRRDARQLPAPEDEALQRLVGQAALSGDQRAKITGQAAELVRAVRASSDPRLMEVFLSAYGLSTKEGVALMCLAEALLRVPDAGTMDDLIRDKIAPHDWSAHSGGSSSIFVNASTWALMLTGKVLDEGEGGIEGTLRAMVRRLGEPVIRTAVSAAMREMGEQFVLGRTIEEAVRRGRPMISKGYLYSYDMLGEAARTEADAIRYHHAYADAISSLNSGSTGTDIRRNPGISVKLSAIHPRYEIAQKETMLPVMSERLLTLALAARHARMGLNIDAEEADRLDLSLDVIERVLAEPELAGWNGFGVVVQAYGPRAAFVIDWLYSMAQRLDRQIMVRLVKGAYWDTEIKRAQTLGLTGYPVFTRKPNTDVSYIANARKLLSMTDRIYPQFATHNAHTVAAILEMAGKNRDNFEFQRLHGMGEALHETVRKAEGTRCRIYAPVGAHSDLLAYLVRRLLENGANSSFVHQITDVDVPAEAIARDPFEIVETQGPAANPSIPKPADIFGTSRSNSRGWDITDPIVLAAIDKARAEFAGPDRWTAAPMTRAAGAAEAKPVVNPAKPGDRVGTVREATVAQVEAAVGIAVAAQPGWASTPAGTRAAILRRAADLYEANAVEFFALATREAGKTLADGIAEVREAVDFLRYYAAEAEGAEAGTAAARRHRLHLALEFSAGDLFRTDRGSPCHRQYRAGQARRADAADRRARGGAAASGRYSAGRAAAAAGRRAVSRRTADGRSAYCRRLLHRLDRRCPPDRAPACQNRSPRRHADRRDRRPQRDDRRFNRAARAGGARHPGLRLPERRPALLGAAPALCPEGRRGQGRRDAERRDAGTERRRSLVDRHRCRPGHRRRSQGLDLGLCRANGEAGQADRQGRRTGRRPLRRAAGVSRVRHRRDGTRGVRAGAACRHLRRREARSRHVRHQPQGLRPDLRPAHPHRSARPGDR